MRKKIDEQERKNKKIRRSIILEFLVIIILLWVVCLYTIFSSTSEQKLFNELHGDVVPGAIAMIKIKYEAAEIRAWTLTYILRGNVVRNNKTIKEWLQVGWTELESEALTLCEHEKHIGIEKKQATEKILELSKKLIFASTKVIELKDQGVESGILFERIKGDFRSAFYPLIEIVNERIEIHLEELSATQAKTNSKHNTLILHITILGIIITLLALIVVLLMNRIFIRYLYARKKAEEALRVSEDKYRTITENVNLGIYRSTVAPKDLFIEANPALVSMFGYKDKDNFMKVHVSDLYKDPADREKFAEKIKKKEFVIDEELQLKRKDGSLFIASVSAVAVKDIEGNIQYYDGIIEDITERKRMEEKLAKSEQDYRGLFENAHDAIIIFTPEDEIILKANLKACELYGFKSSELIGMSLKKISKNIKRGQKIIKETLRKEKTINFETIHYRKDGTEIFLESNAAVINYKGQRAILAINRDVSNRKEAEEEIKSHREHLKLINKILRHDLANDLATIKSAISIFSRSKDEIMLQHINKRVDKSVNLIRNMRELEQLILTQKNIKVYNVHEVLNEIRDNYKSIVINISGKAKIMADEALSSVFDNIIRNAIVHGKADKIDINIQNEDNQNIVKIADNGSGIPDNIKEKIFDEDFKYGKTGSAGLGLFIVKKAIGNYGGKIYVEDNKPHGTVFVLIFKKVF